MEATALHDFEATAEDELGFSRGEVLNIVSMEDDPNWYTAELRGKSGLVPCNYIEMRPHPWYIKNCSREEAETRLLETRGTNNFVQPDGAFIVRRSNAPPPGFSLSVKNGPSVIHFKVLQDEQKKFFLWVFKFSSINELIEHHKRTSISRTNTILLQDRVHSPKYDRDEKGAKRVIAHFDFEPTENDELPFKRGDIIQVVGKDDENWWIGELNGQKGLFPSSYVGPINPGQ